MHRILPTLVLATVLVAGASCSRASSGGALPPWRDLGPIAGIPPHRVLRQPTLAVLGQDLVYAGSALFPDSGTHRGVFEVRTVGGRSLGRPAGDFRFGNARAAVHAPTGTLHLVWGESDGAATRPDGWPARYTSLWHASYAGGAWSAATRIVEGHTIGWGSGAGPLAVDRAGCVHVAVPLFHDAGAGLHYARGFCVPWRDTVLARGITYAAVATTDAAVLVAVAGRDSTSPGYRNVVRVLRSTDGATWTHLSRVGLRAPEDRAEQVWLGWRDRQVHLAWIQELAAGGSMLDDAGRPVPRVGNRVVRLVSRDGGTTWADTMMSAVEPQAIFNARFLAHRCGVLAAYEAVTGVDARLTATARVVDLRRNGAAPASAFPGTFMSFEPAPALQRDTLLLLVGVLKAGSDTSVARLASRPACHDAVIH